MISGEILDELSGLRIPLMEGGNLVIQTAPYSIIGVLDSLDEDILRLAASVYAADLAIKRAQREQHLRTITVRVPVVNFDAFTHVKRMIEEAVTTLSCDNWTLEFVEQKGTPALSRPWPKKRHSTLMFSGGLDSFVGAVHFTKSDPYLTLVSHTTHNRPVAASQLDLAMLLGKTTKTTHIQIPVWCRKTKILDFPSDAAREETQRTRSLLFTCLAAVAARLEGARRIVIMAENGQFAIHLPLTEARIGSFSTHTAHPKFLQQMQAILRTIYRCADLEVTNPFVHFTKGEVVGLLPKLFHKEIYRTVSCWRTSRLPTGFTHCGECIPCLSRRIATEIQQQKIPEYKRDLFSENIGRLPPSDLGKRNLSDLCQFVTLFAGPNQVQGDHELLAIFPELRDPSIDTKQVIDMYRRFSAEALNVFSRYSYVTTFLK